MKSNKLNKYLLAGGLIGVYTYIGISSNGAVIVPAVIAAIFGFLLLHLNKKHVNILTVRFLAYLVGVALLSIVFTSNIHDLWGKGRGLLFFVYSLLISYGFYLGLSRLSKRSAERLFFATIIILIIGCFAENFLGLRTVSDAFRNLVYSSGVYSGDDRDIGLVGMIRPKLFTSEPSYVATFFSFSASVWFLLTESKMKFIKFLGLLFLGILLIGSPMILLAVVNGLIIYMHERNRGPWLLTPVKYSVMVLVSIATVMAMLSTSLQARFDEITSGNDDSFTLRVVTPIFVTFEVLGENPVWGSGLSSSEVIQKQIVVGAIKSGLVSLQPDNIDRIQNTFWAIWIYLGLLGGALYFWTFFKFLRSFQIASLTLSGALLLVLTQAGLGDFYAPRFWIYTMLLIAALEIVEREPRRL